MNGSETAAGPVLTVTDAIASAIPTTRQWAKLALEALGIDPDMPVEKLRRWLSIEEWTDTEFPPAVTPRIVIERRLASARAALANQAGRAGSAAVVPAIVAFQERLLDQLKTSDHADSQVSP